MACFDLEMTTPQRPYTRDQYSVRSNMPPLGFGALEKVSLSYFPAVDVAVVDPGDDKSLATNVDTLGVCLLDGGLLAVHDARNVLHLLGADLFRSSAVSQLYPSPRIFLLPGDAVVAVLPRLCG